MGNIMANCFLEKEIAAGFIVEVVNIDRFTAIEQMPGLFPAWGEFERV